MSISTQLEVTLVSCAIAVACVLACSRDEPTAQLDEGEPVVGAAVPTPNQLPQLILTDETPDLLLTWIDAKGDFHVVTKPSEVPDEGREQVRVVVTTKEEGVGRLVYVADMRAKQADGTYPVKTLTRAQWNDIGAERRKVRMEAVSRAEPTDAPVDEGKPSQVSSEEKQLNARVRAVVYGADWCKPCHDAEDYLKELGVHVTKKDIEESRAARAEMNKKLADAGRMGASIPVLDVGGKILIGFSRPSVKEAVVAARKPETL